MFIRLLVTYPLFLSYLIDLEFTEQDLE